MKINIEEFSNSHGWVNYEELNEFIETLGFNIIELDRHNETDGELHFLYCNKKSSKIYEFNGNYWHIDSFNELIDWLNNIKTPHG